MTQTIHEAAVAAPGAVLWAVVGAGALLVPVVMLAWGATRGSSADLSSHPSPFRARLLVAAKASLAIPGAVAAGFPLLQGGWWSAGSPLAELGPGALVLGLTLWFALSAWARISEAARFVAAGVRLGVRLDALGSRLRPDPSPQGAGRDTLGHETGGVAR